MSAPAAASAPDAKQVAAAAAQPAAAATSVAVLPATASASGATSTAAPTFEYSKFVERNLGYVDSEVQGKMRSTRLLIAGCGLGASTAICAARMGFENFVLVDGDTVGANNLNRQFYDFSDVGTAKVTALRNQILRINPQATVDARHENLTQANVADLIGGADIVFDTIDFLDLGAILALHSAAKALGKPVFTALSIGYGAGVLFFPAEAGAPSLVDLIAADVKLADGESEAGAASYAAVFAKVLMRVADRMDAQVVAQISKALTIMEDGRPCPASQIAVGSFTVGAMAVAMMHDLLAGLSVPRAPIMLTHSFRNHTTTQVDISK